MSQAASCGVRQVIATAVGRTKRIEQTERRNGRISILGVATGQKLQHAWFVVQSESYIKVIDWIAEQTSETLGQLDG